MQTVHFGHGEFVGDAGHAEGFGCGESFGLGEFVGALAHRIAAFPAAGHAAVKERVNAIALAPVDDFRRDSDRFGSGVTEPEAQARIRTAIERGLQTRDAELDLTRVLSV